MSKRVGCQIQSSLTISDRDGRLNATGTAPAALFSTALKIPVAKRDSLNIAIGYRWLVFDDVKLHAVQGFIIDPAKTTVVHVQLPQSLDYSGWFRIGIGMGFSATATGRQRAGRRRPAVPATRSD